MHTCTYVLQLTLCACTHETGDTRVVFSSWLKAPDIRAAALIAHTLCFTRKFLQEPQCLFACCCVGRRGRQCHCSAMSILAPAASCATLIGYSTENDPLQFFKACRAEAEAEMAQPDGCTARPTCQPLVPVRAHVSIPLGQQPGSCISKLLLLLRSRALHRRVVPSILRDAVTGSAGQLTCHCVRYFTPDLSPQRRKDLCKLSHMPFVQLSMLLRRSCAAACSDVPPASLQARAAPSR